MSDYENWKNGSIRCPECGWEGLGSETTMGESFNDGAEYHCPICEYHFGFIQYPMTEPDPNFIGHVYFKEFWTQGKVQVDVNKSEALKILSTTAIPKRYRIAHLFWTWVGFLSVPLFVFLSFSYNVWVGLALLFFVSPAIISSAKKSASQHIINFALEDIDFYVNAVKTGLIRVTKKP